MAQQDREAKLYIASRYKSTHTHARIHVRTHKTTADTRVIFSFIGYTREDSSAKINSRRVFALPRQFSRHRRDYGKWHEMSTLSILLSAVCFFRSGNSMSHSRTRDFTNDTDTLSTRTRLRCLSQEEARK